MAINQLLNQTGTLENPTGSSDRHGNLGFTDAATIAMRFERSTRTIVTKEREREPIDGTVFVAPNVSVSMGARITFDSQRYRVMRVTTATLGNGKTHHIELLVQSWSYAS